MTKDNTEEYEKIYQELMKLHSIEGLAFDKVMQKIGYLIDLSDILNKEEGSERAINLGQEFLDLEISELQKAEMHYFIGNAYSTRWKMSKEKGHGLWIHNWDNDLIERIILNLRRSYSSNAFHELPEYRKLQILHNLANILDTVGRPIKALKYYNELLKFESKFGMALGNRAFTESLYSNSLYDYGHRNLFMSFVRSDLETVCHQDSDLIFEYGAKSKFKLYLDDLIHSHNGSIIEQNWNLYNHNLGETKEEQNYRKWVLKNKLFLNPLNDLGSFPIASQDILHLPTHTTPLTTGPKFLGAFNQIKQSYVSARFLLYENMFSEELHFSDKRVLLYDTLDYPNYSLRIEKLKMSFRLLYGLFDQIAFFLNDYFELGINEKGITFLKFWYEKKGILREKLTERKNRPLQGLFWISKDLFEQKEDFNLLLNPEARDLKYIRNCLEHRYLKVHTYYIEPKDEITRGISFDSLAFSIEEQMLIKKTLSLVSLVREAIIYASLSIKEESNTKNSNLDTIPHFPVIMNEDFKR